MAPPGARSYPTAAFILTLIGAILIIINAIYWAALYSAASSIAGFAFFPGLEAVLLGLALVALLFGLIILFAAIQMYRRPSSARTWGIIALIISLISIIGGGGFVIGLILGLVGGILAIIWHPPAMMAQPAWGSAPAAPPMAPAAGAPGQKVCGSCGTANAAGAQFCAKCGATLPA